MNAAHGDLSACPVHNASERSRDAWDDSIARLARVENEQARRRAIRADMVARGLLRAPLRVSTGTH